MKYRLLDLTGLYVSELHLGTIAFGNQGFLIDFKATYRATPLVKTK
jgi:aryl-alcohol dehydrogenase-like predicted oxidoreductase